MDVSDNLELLRLAEEVDATHEPRLLRRGDRVLALIIPLPGDGEQSGDGDDECQPDGRLSPRRAEESTT